jgi:hypothetical protein
MLQLQLVPGKGLGDFTLGMPIAESINVIQQNIDAISHVELKFNESDPLNMDIILDLTEDGFLLRFEPASQRLKMIEIYDVPKVTLTYCGSVFSAANVPPTFVLIYSRFGPSYPGDYNSAKNAYYLHYPNLSFKFPIPAKYHSLYTDGTAAPHSELPVEFPDGTTPITTRIYIYNGSSLSAPTLPQLAPTSLYFEPVVVNIGSGLFFTKRNASLGFDSSPQDVISELGPPTRVYYKEEDKMRIHSVSSNGVSYADYFYNYFPLGLDFLFDAHTHTVKKIVLHTNFPTHFEFNQYSKCNFRIAVPKPTEDLSANGEGEHVVYIEPDMRWDGIQGLFGKASKPVVNSRTTSTNPFGATYFYGYPGVIFEVMRNNHIASVCIFSQPRERVLKE